MTGALPDEQRNYDQIASSWLVAARSAEWRASETVTGVLRTERRPPETWTHDALWTKRHPPGQMAPYRMNGTLRYGQNTSSWLVEALSPERAQYWQTGRPIGTLRTQLRLAPN